MKLICFDMDGVLIKPVHFWNEVHKVFGTVEEGERLTKKYLHSNYALLVEQVMKLWRGKEAGPYFELVNSVEYMEGVREVFDFIKEKGYTTAIISASSIHVAERIQRYFGVDHIFANKLVIDNNRVTGEFVWPIGAGNHKKAEIIRKLCAELRISSKEVIYIGDDDIDFEAFQEVGVSIAFNSKSKGLRKVATHVVEGDDLRKIIQYLRMV